MLVLGLGLGLVTQVLGSWPWPWPWDPSPWPRPVDSIGRGRCYHALHLRPGICGMEFVERILAVPVISAPIERVYSNSGLIIRPHRAKMSDKLLESLCLPSVPTSAKCCDG